MSVDEPVELLLIEDNRGDARYLEEVLRDATAFETRDPDRGVIIEGMSGLQHESTLEAGLDAMNDEIDVVLLNLHLPDSDGLETLTRVTERALAPVIVVSNQADRELGLEAIRRGADDYLVKSEITSDLLIRAVYHAIERREHARELRKYESLIERSTDVKAILDRDATVRYITPSVKGVLGYAREELVGENALSYVHREDKEKVERSLQSVIEAEEELRPIEFRIRHADGSWVTLESRARNLLDDPLIEGIVVYTRDVTERVARERKLERFSRVVSHDLRNPIAIAQMYLSAYHREGREDDLDRVQSSLERMDDLIDTLLELAQEGESIDERKHTSLPDVIEAAWAQVEVGEVSLEYDTSLGSIHADPERLQTVLENLFRNAHEHGRETGEIRVEGLAEGFAVEDDGTGIDPDVGDSIFEFGISTGNGTGSGLAIVQEIVRAHGWEIDATDGTTGGARFEITGMERIP